MSNAKFDAFGIEVRPEEALQQQLQNEAALQSFQLIFNELLNEKAQSEHRQQQLALLFTSLRACSHDLKLETLNRFASLIHRHPVSIFACNNLMPLTIRAITDLIHSNPNASAAGAGNQADLLSALFVRLFQLVGMIGAESITVRDLGRLFRLFQMTIDRKSSPVLCRLLLTSLCDMANVHERNVQLGFPDPVAFFEFRGPQPAIVIPPMDSWPAPKACSISMWVRWDHDQREFNEQQRIMQQRMRTAEPAPSSSLFSRRPAQPQQTSTGFMPAFAYLYSFLTSKARGIEACIEKHTCKLYLRSAGKNGMVEVNTEIVIPTKRWVLITIVQQKPKTFSRSTGQVTVMLNDQIRYEGELAYPVISEGVVSNAIGANITNIHPQTAFHGRLGSVYMFSRALSVVQVASLWKKGSDFPMSSLAIGEKNGLLKSFAMSTLNLMLKPVNSVLGVSNDANKPSNQTASSASTTSSLSAAELEWLKSLVFLYHPLCVENGMAVHDLSHEHTKVRSTLNATMAAGVEARAVFNVKEVMHCMIGGIRAFFPIFWHIDALSPPYSSAIQGRSSASLASLALQTLTALIKDNPSNQNEILECSGFAVLGYILSQPKQVPSHHLNEHLITAIEELSHYCSWLLLDSDAARVHLASPSNSDGRTAANTNAADALPLQLATEPSLFNHLFKELLFNFALWIRAPHTEQLTIAKLCRRHVAKQPRYFRRLIHPSVIFDRMRRYLSYEEAVQAEMVKEIREREQLKSSATSPSPTASRSKLDSSASFSSFAAPMQEPLNASPTRDQAIAARLRQLRSLRSEWFFVIKDLMLADLTPRSLASNISSMIQVCCDLSDSLQIAEVMELLTALSFAAPDHVLLIVERFGGPMLFVTILQRHSHHVHVQVATFHLLSAILRGLPPDIKTENSSLLNAIFIAIQDCLISHPLTLPAYHACLELVLSLAPGTLGVKNGAEFAVDFNYRQHCGDVSLPHSPSHDAQHAPALLDIHRSSSSSASVISSFSSMAFARQSQIKFPLGLELMFELTKQKPRSPSAAASSPSDITRLVPAMPMAQLLVDLDALLSASPSQCAVILYRWPAWPRSLIAQLDWNAHTSTVQQQATSPSASRKAAGLFDLDSFTSGQGNVSLEQSGDNDIFFRDSGAPDVFADIMANQDDQEASSNDSGISLSLLSMRILEALLYHSIVHIRDGWIQWRDTLMFLRDAANASEVNEARFRETRRELFVGLLQRIRSSAESDFYLSTGAVTEQLKMNLAHVIDILEEILYFHELNDTSNNAVSRTIQSPPPSSLENGLELSSMPSDIAPVDDEKWTLVSEEDTRDILDSSLNSKGGVDSQLPGGSSSTSFDHILFMRFEWVLVQELLSCLQVLAFPLQPLRHLNAKIETTSFFDALKSNGDEPQPVRGGGPLRPVLRILLDCVASLIAGDSSGSSSAESVASHPRQLASMLNSIQQIASRELSPASIPSVNNANPGAAAPQARGADRRTFERTWRNQYALLVVFRLCALTRAASESMRSTLVEACRSLVDVLQPFALVSALNFVTGPENPDGSDRVVYVPLVITPNAQLDVSPTFNFQLSTASYDLPVVSSSNMSTSNAGSHRSGSMSSNAPAGQSLATLYPSSFTRPNNSHSYTRVLRACMDYVHGAVKTVATAESRAVAEFSILVDRTHASVAARLSLERESWRKLSTDRIILASRALASFQYTEANRKAVVDALWRESQRELQEKWRDYQWQLFVEGSAWLPQAMAGKRRFWQIDPTEDKLRMRRKLRQFHEGSDLKQSSLAQDSGHSTSRAVVRSKTASQSSVSQSSIDTPTRALTISPTDDSEIASPELQAESVLPDDSITGDALDLAQNQLALIESQLHVRNVGDEDQAVAMASEELNEADIDVDNDADVAHSDEHGAANSEHPDDENDEKDQDHDEDEDRSASDLPDDWDMLSDQWDVNRPIVSTNSHSYTSPSVVLVLPFTTLTGTLEIGSKYFQFVPNLNAEMTDRNGRAIHGKGGDGRRVWTLPGLDAQRKRAKKNRVWETSAITGVSRRRYQLQKSAIEIFTSGNKNYFLDFGSREERRTVIEKILALKPPKLNKTLSLRAWDMLSRQKLTQRWQKRELSNFDYLMALNSVSGRTYNDLNQYPVFPWVLSYYPNKGEEDPNIDLISIINAPDAHHPQASSVFRDLSRPVGALNEERLDQILERYQSMVNDHAGDKSGLPPYHYGSHYSNAGIVMYYLMRCEPFASLHVEFQAGRFDFADRLFYSIGQTWHTCMKSLSCFKELTPEFFYHAAFLDNVNGFDLGTKQDGTRVGDVLLPSWAADSAEFVRIHRLALESEYVSAHLHEWIDLIFGYKQKGKAAADSHNLFFHLTYEGAVDINSITDPVLQTAVKDQIALFGQTPMQLFRKAHPMRHSKSVERVERLKPPPIFLQQGPNCIVPAMRRTALLDRAPVVAATCCSNGRFITVSSSFLVGLHVWQPQQPDELVDRRPDGTQRKYTVPFTHSMAAHDKIEKQSQLEARHVLVSPDAKLLFEANNWDESLRVYALASTINAVAGLKNQSTPSGSVSCVLYQHLRHHKARVTCLSMSGNLLVTGSMDCTLLVWRIDVESVSKIAGLVSDGRSYVRSEPLHRIRGHEDEILACDVNNELDICLSTSSRGLVLLHSALKGTAILRVRVASVAQLRAQSGLSPDVAVEELVRGPGFVDAPIEVDYGLEGNEADERIQETTSPRAANGKAAEAASTSETRLVHPIIQLNHDGQMIFASHFVDVSRRTQSRPQFAVCGINGRNWRAVLLTDAITAIAVSKDGKLIACGAANGAVCIRRSHDLHIIQQYEPAAGPISSLSFTHEQEYVLAGSTAGDFNIFPVYC